MGPTLWEEGAYLGACCILGFAWDLLTTEAFCAPILFRFCRALRPVSTLNFAMMKNRMISFASIDVNISGTFKRITYNQRMNLYKS